MSGFCTFTISENVDTVRGPGPKHREHPVAGASVLCDDVRRSLLLRHRTLICLLTGRVSQGLKYFNPLTL